MSPQKPSSFSPRALLSIAALVASVLAVGLAPSATVGAVTFCTATTIGNTVELVWDDTGGTHVVRRNGGWLSTPGEGTSSFVDRNPIDGGTYLIRTLTDDGRTDRECTTGAAPAPIPVPATGCVASSVGGTVQLSWDDNGGTHVVRRNGDWLSTPGAGTSSFVDQNPIDGGTYVVRTFADNGRTDRQCTNGTAPVPNGRRFVVHVSMDGLRADAITASDMPTLWGMIGNGASTMNARTDPAITKTLANHTSQFTGRFLDGSDGHHVAVNEDNGGTVHAFAEDTYVASVFDVVHDNGGRTVVYTGKDKFFLHNRSWNDTNGAADTVGADNGRDKIDVFEKEDPLISTEPFVADLTAGTGSTFGFYHIRTPDEYGHLQGWDTTGYRIGLRKTDDALAALVTSLNSAGVMANTTLIITSDHGGPRGDVSHADATSAQNYTVPFVVWGADVGQGVDLYAINPTRVDPGTSQINRFATQPIRGHEVANLALDLLGLPAVPDSSVNVNQDLRVR